MLIKQTKQDDWACEIYLQHWPSGNGCLTQVKHKSAGEKKKTKQKNKWKVCNKLVAWVCIQNNSGYTFFRFFFRWTVHVYVAKNILIVVVWRFFNLNAGFLLGGFYSWGGTLLRLSHKSIWMPLHIVSHYNNKLEYNFCYFIC